MYELIYLHKPIHISCLYIYMNIYLYKDMNIYLYIYIHEYLCIYIYMNIYLYISIYIYTYIYPYMVFVIISLSPISTFVSFFHFLWDATKIASTPEVAIENPRLWGLYCCIYVTLVVGHLKKNGNSGWLKMCPKRGGIFLRKGGPLPNYKWGL